MEKVRFGVIGTNFITDWVIKGASEDPRFELTAVCSRTRERAMEFAARHGARLTFTSVEEMASSDAIDAVYVASPNYMHASQSITCMSHGKHVLCEKPLASNAEEVRLMIEASERYGVALMEAMMPTLTPNFRRVMESMGRVGQMRRYFSSFCQYSSRYDRFKRGEMVNAFDTSLSNSALMDIGVYTVYPMVVLFGKPLETVATGQLLSSGADGQGTLLFRYDGMDAIAIYSKISNSLLASEIQGEDGVLTLDSIHHIRNVEFTPRATTVCAGKGGTGHKENLTAYDGHDDYYHEVAEFISIILEGKRESPVNSHRNSLITIELLDEARRQLGVRFPADTKTKVML